ncbi:Cohesin subunit SA-1 [Orchesella cincta]|uniref:Cohesin subunit SA-1 n=1 Tax=Orchesella cincta TaxID=48709 RepID=A0A1D2N068_ORCCI|nr:Cohesin subunit SA-1 [Orchesella cincta]
MQWTLPFPAKEIYHILQQICQKQHQRLVYPNTRRRAAAAAASTSVGSTTPARRSKRKVAEEAAAARVETASPTSVDEGTPKRTRRGAASKKQPPPPPIVEQQQVINEDDDDSLYNAILQGKCSLQQLVDDWIEDYKGNRDSALLRLNQFFISGSGCKGKITPQMATMEQPAIIRKMTEEFDEDSGEYPLVMSGQQWKKFKGNYCDFVQTLVKQCQYSIIYDQYLMDNVISLLTGLSDSQVRAFRHTATLAAMKLMTALVDVALTVSINLDNTQRQYDSERQKTSVKRAAERLEALMGKRQELEENMDEIKNMLTYMFKSVFVHRYRDTLPEIRAICMAEIGVWMKKFHQNFLDDSYLKYIGWTLHDKVGEVRLKCLQALQPLYASEELKGKLELFTSKFKDRIVAMTLDKEYDVAVQAVKLVILIHKYHREILTDKDCELVYELVYSSHRAVAQAAGEFLNERLFVIDEGAVENIRTARGKQRLPNTPLIRDLVQFFIESELHEHGAYLVDSLIESNPMMKDWECMTDLLLEEPGPAEEPLDDKQESSLIEIMVCAVRQCATGEPPIGRGPTRKILSAKELKQVSDDKNRLTEHFIPILPALLTRFKADPDKVANLLSLPQYFDLEIYTTSRQEKSLDMLLELIKDVVEQHTEMEVLETSAKTLEIICCDDARKSSRTEVALMNVLESLWDKALDGIIDYENNVQDGGEADEDDLYNINMSLRKISVFYGCHSFDKWDVWAKLFRIIKTTVDNIAEYPAESVKHAISACYFALLWDLKNIQEKGEHGVSGTDDVPKLHRKLNDYMAAMKVLVSHTEAPHSFREEAYTSICDGLIIFCEQLNTQKWMETLVYQPDQDLQRLLNKFMQDNVFSELRDDELDEHARIELLHKMRNYLAQFCKLIVYNVMPISAAADVFKYYVKHYNDYGDIIKATLGKAREINKVNCALTMIVSLTSVFADLPKVNTWMVDRQCDEFNALKDLAKRFALSFGLDAIKNREAITALHREGILYSVNPLENPIDSTGPPPNLAFLEILAEFTNKLLKQDKRVVLQYLDSRVGSAVPSSQGAQWQPLYTYRNSLMHGESDKDNQPQFSKRAYTRKRQVQDGDVDQDDVDADPDDADAN